MRSFPKFAKKYKSLKIFNQSCISIRDAQGRVAKDVFVKINEVILLVLNERIPRYAFSRVSGGAHPYSLAAHRPKPAKNNAILICNNNSKHNEMEGLFIDLWAALLAER